MQVALNIVRQEVRGLAYSTVLLSFVGKTADACAAFGLDMPLQLLVLHYFSGSNAYLNLVTVLWYGDAPDPSDVGTEDRLRCVAGPSNAPDAGAPPPHRRPCHALRMACIAALVLGLLSLWGCLLYRTARAALAIACPLLILAGVLLSFRWLRSTGGE